MTDSMLKVHAHMYH